MRPPRLPAVSLFSNCGAGDVGYARAGFRFKVLGEIEQRRLDVAALNHREADPIVGDLRATWPKVVASYRRSMGDEPPALLSACPPCQGLSSAQSRRGCADDADAGSRDTRNLLVEVIADVGRELAPRVIVVENVLAFMTRKVRHPDTDHPISAARLLLDRLRGDYAPFALRANLADFGVPQTRRRAFIVLVRRDEPALPRMVEVGRAPFPAATHGAGTEQPHVTLRAALTALAAGPLDARDAASAGTGMHRVPVWDDDRYRMVASIPPDSGRSAWANSFCAQCGDVQVGDDDAACPECGRPLPRPVVTRDGKWRLIHGFRNSSYRRMAPDQPASAITTASGRSGSDNTLHPSEHRVLSMRECQRLQTIPDTFDWGDHLKSHGHTSLRAMIGEAVPPQFTELHGRVLASLLDGRVPRLTMRSDDWRA
ncbi:MAG: (cytosine-5)-methyltransferase 1, partial [Solirubrobacteraceae bacterium]|nr:(cytosine-5)-methyltransferase 1 [Solirubrobacteraceae bacterium]